MKRLLLPFLLALSFFGKPAETQAQVHLKIVGLIGFPDSAYTNLAYPITAVVQNIGNTPYQGTVQVVMLTDSGAAVYLYQSSTSRVLLPGDTAGLSSPNGFTFNPSVFRQGGNVVVVWPYAGSAALIDTITTSVYIYGQYTGIRELGNIDNLKAYPNPTSNGLTIESINEELESVRIYDLEGRTIAIQKLSGFGSHPIAMEVLEPGMYLLEVISKENHRSVVRVLKTKE